MGLTFGQRPKPTFPAEPISTVSRTYHFEIRRLAAKLPVTLPTALLLPGANVERLVCPGFLELRGVHRFVMGYRSRAVRLATTDHVGPVSTA